MDKELDRLQWEGQARPPFLNLLPEDARCEACGGWRQECFSCARWQCDCPAGLLYAGTRHADFMANRFPGCPACFAELAAEAVPA